MKHMLSKLKILLALRATINSIGYRLQKPVIKGDDILKFKLVHLVVYSDF